MGMSDSLIRYACGIILVPGAGVMLEWWPGDLHVSGCIGLAHHCSAICRQGAPTLPAHQLGRQPVGEQCCPPPPFCLPACRHVLACAKPARKFTHFACLLASPPACAHARVPVLVPRYFNKRDPVEVLESDPDLVRRAQVCIRGGVCVDK